jgi:hypothetical protein
MPSLILTRASGAPFPLVSGDLSVHFSGQMPKPVGGVFLHLDRSASGNAYVALSGGSTLLSGGFFLSGLSADPGIVLKPGDSFFVPKLCCGPSGRLDLFGASDAAASGQARLHYEIM